MSSYYLVLSILVMASVTYLTRITPLLAVNFKIKSIFVRSFLHYIPFAVLGAMTFPFVFFSTGSLISASFGMVVAVIVAFRGRGLMVAASLGVLVVYVVELGLKFI